MRRYYYVYILASKRNGTLYTGVTGEDPLSAIKREKQIKRWRRAWKLRLIEKDNPRWVDLYDNLLSELPMS
jgi:putative endonuclease